jgi:tetratricopeptide (TPR) repeat protein
LSGGARRQALIALDREPEAIAAFGAALAVDPSLADLERRIEVLRFRGLERDLATARAAARSQRTDEARRAFQAAKLAAVEKQAGAQESALGYFRRAVELDPSDAASWGQIGELLEARDQREAMAAYNTSLGLEPNDAIEARRDALIALAELAKLPEEYRAIDGLRLSSLVLGMRSREALVVTDVRPHWAESWIMAVGRAGIIEPFANHTFQPHAIVRRADLAQAANRILARVGTPAQVAAWQNARAKFTDIAVGHLAYAAASVAVASGVMAAAPDGSFQPSRPVTGAEAIETVQRLQAMADRAAGRAGGGR